MSERIAVLQVKNLRKEFKRVRLDYGLKDILLHSISHIHRLREQKKFIALDDISFELYPGESMAVLGRNGAGKSTLLSLLAGILYPTSGEIILRGRTGLMLELGSGFAHDLSGRENIMLNGLLLGADQKELQRRMDEIIDFSGIGDFIDEPLRTYSTGMQTRLGFAIAVHTRPDLLLIDEVLAVGDSEFRRKCLSKLSEMKQQGTAVLLVTHALDDAEKFCDRAMYIENGEIRFSGQTAAVITAIKENACEY